MKSRLVGLTLLMVVGCGVGGWLFRDNLKARYYAHQLLAVPDADLTAWVDQAPAWGEGVPDRLIECLAHDDPTTCARAGAALARAAEGREAVVAKQFSDRFSRLSAPGKQAVLDCAATLATSQQTDVIAACRTIVRQALQHSDTDVRARASALAMRADFGQADLLVPLLKDPAAEVRRTALLAIGPSRNLIADDDLLPLLHDQDADVRKLTETVLRSRGLRPRDVRLGRLLTDPKPSGRLDLLVELRDDRDLDLSTWLRRLCEDPAPAVRAAAARLADERQVFQLTDRLAQMAKADPDQTVRQAAGYHLHQLQSPVRPVSAP
jgi:hypothetical protein